MLFCLIILFAFRPIPYTCFVRCSHYRYSSFILIQLIFGTCLLSPLFLYISYNSQATIRINKKQVIINYIFLDTRLLVAYVIFNLN